MGRGRDRVRLGEVRRHGSRGVDPGSGGRDGGARGDASTRRMEDRGPGGLSWK
jgi:hypothetical protein